MLIFEIITEARKTLDWMWLIDPKNKELKFRRRRKGTETHAEWMEKIGLVPKDFSMHVMSNNYDPKYVSKFDNIIRGCVEVDLANKKIYYEQHTCHWDPKRKQVQQQFINLFPQVKLFTWIQLGK